MNREVQKLLAVLNPQSSPTKIEQNCKGVIESYFLSFQQKCQSHFIVSHVYFKTLNNFNQAQKILLNMLQQDLNDRQSLQCYGRLAFINIFSHKEIIAKNYHYNALKIIQNALQNQKRSLINLLLWVYCGMKNPNINNPYYNLIISYVQQKKNNYQQSAILFKKIFKQNSDIDINFIKWKMDELNETNPKSRRQVQFQNLNEALFEVYGFFDQSLIENQIKYLDQEKNKVLQYLKIVYNKYKDYEQYLETLEIIQQQIYHLETDQIPLSLIQSISYQRQNSPNRLQVSTLNITSQNMIPKTKSYIQPQTNMNNYQTPSLIKSSTMLIPTPTPLTYSLRNPTLDSSYIPRTNGNIQSMNMMSSSYLKPPVGWLGSELIKLNYTTDGQKIKFFYIGDPNKKRIYYCQRKDKPDTKFDSYYQIHNMNQVNQGKTTKAFLRKSSSRYDESLCFSIILANKTRDFVALNTQDYSFWIYTLKRFLITKDNSLYISQALNQSTTSSISRQNWGSLNMSKK